MTIEIKKNFTETVIEVAGRLDTVTAPTLENAIAEMPPKLVKKIVSGPTITPSAISKRELEDIYNKIFDGSFHAGVNRTFHIDGYLPKAKMIQDFLHES